LTYINTIQTNKSEAKKIFIFLIAETYWQHAVIARPANRRTPHSKILSKQIADAIADRLGAYITVSDITYKPPNFLIHFTEPHLQRHALVTTKLQTRSCNLEMAPWSKQHELGQLPWIIGMTTI